MSRDFGGGGTGNISVSNAPASTAAVDMRYIAKEKFVSPVIWGLANAVTEYHEHYRRTTALGDRTHGAGL